MKWLKRGEITIIVLFFVIVSFFAFRPPIIGGAVTGSAVADTITEGMCINVFINDITPSSVGINKDFTVGILIDNCGEELPTNVIFEITKVSSDIKIKEPLIQDIGKMGYANSERFLVYHMRTTNDASPGIHSISYKLTYGNGNYKFIKENNFTITILGDEAKLGVASIKTDPVLPVKGDTVELMLRIENYGDGVANSVKVHLDHGFQGPKESYIGTLDAEEDGPVIFTFVTKEAGDFEIPVTISYQDDFGEKEIKKNINITILEKESNLVAIVIVIVIILVIIASILYFLKMKKAKDKIIHQLLTKNGNNKEKKSK